MNNTQMIFQIRQATSVLDDIQKDLEDGSLDNYGDLALMVKMTEVFNFLCLAWHTRYMDSEKVANLDKDEYERYLFLIPALDPRFEFET